MKVKKSKLFITAILSALIICTIVYGFIMYNKALRYDLSGSILETLNEVTEQQKFNISSKISSDISTVKNFAYIAGSMDLTKDAVMSAAEDLVKNTDFEYVIVANTKGEGRVSSGETVSLMDREYYKKALSGETVVGSPIKSRVRDATVIPIATPIYTNGTISGVLVGSYTTQKLSELFLTSFGGRGFVYVTDHDGNIIVKPDNEYALLVNQFKVDNLFKGLENANFLEYKTKDQMMRSIEEKGSGYLKLSVSNVSEFMHYAPIGVNDWYIFVIVPEEYIAARATAISNRAVWLAFAIIVVFILFIIYILLMHNKTDREKAAHTRQLERVAYYDELTGLPNLNKFKLDVERILRNNPDRQFLIAKVDILNFKMINELFGFDVGDDVVKSVGDFIKIIMQEKSVDGLGCLARVTADEFIILDIVHPDMKKIDFGLDPFEATFNGQKSQILKDHRIEFRHGRYFLDKGETDVNSAIEKANLAHRMVKEKKDIKVCDYDDEFKQQVLRDIEIENKMHNALANNEFKVYLQPKYDLYSEVIVGAEALVRWQEADGRIIPPGDFIPLFERDGFVTKLDMYMFRNVCTIIKGWLEQGLPAVTVSVNFSRLHLADESFVSKINEIANSYSIPKKYIEIELTESIIFNNEEVLKKLINDLHTAGFSLSMDDFGTGYSSLGLLKNLPVDVVKIDRSFFIDNTHKSRSKAVIESVMQMAKKLRIHTVAEGVETKEHIDFLRQVGCDIVQGYYYAKPMPASEFHNSGNRFIPDNQVQTKAEFDLRRLGGINIGKILPNETIPASVYRLFQCSIRGILNDRYGNGEMAEAFIDSGRIAGRIFAKANLDLSLPFERFISQLERSFIISKLGILKVEKVDKLTNSLTVAIGEDLECSGAQVLEETICRYDEGFIAGILYEYTKRDFVVTEVDCRGTGSDVCRFRATPKAE